MAVSGEFVTEMFEYDGGRQVTVYVPTDPPEAIVFAGDGQRISEWGRLLEQADVPSTMIVGVHGLTDEMPRLHEYSPGFEPERFAAHEKFFVEDVRRWTESQFGVALRTERTAVFGVSAGGELALALGLRHPHVYGAVFCASPGGGYKPPGVMPKPLPRTYLVAGTQEPFFLENARTWADALRDADADVVMNARAGSHGGAFWREEFPLMWRGHSGGDAWREAGRLASELTVESGRFILAPSAAPNVLTPGENGGMNGPERRTDDLAQLASEAQIGGHMIGSSGTHRIVAKPAEGALWTAVQNLVAADHDLCGELAVSDDGQRIVYVAARRDADQALRLVLVDRVADSSRPTTLDSYEVAYYDTLDESVPARDLLCRQCAHRLPTWSAVCAHCRHSTALTAVSRGAWSRANARPAVTAVLGPDCTPVGELPTAAGSIVEFVRDDSTGEIVVLAFERNKGRDDATRAVPVGRLRRPSAEATHRRSSPHSGEVGPLRPDPMAPAPAVDLTGRILGGKFRVLRLLGEGGMGRVYLAEHVRIRRRSALKVLSPGLVGHPESIRRFDAEARNASRIAHPNVAVVYDFEETPDGLVYIVLEYIDGETLGAVIAREIWLDIPRAVRIARDTAAALQAAHDLGIVHRDLKPDNIMLTRTAAGEEFVKVVDFGISKAAEEAGSNSRVTRTGFVIGTPQYMSPEQLAGDHVDARSDVYSLGCVLFEAVTGRRTFASGTTAKPKRRERRTREGVPRALDAIVKRALSAEPEDRYHTAQEMREALDHMLAALERRERRSRHRIALRIGAGMVAAAVIGGAWMFMTQRGRLARDHEVAAVPLVAAAPATPAAVAPTRPSAAPAPATPPKAPAIRPTPARAATDVPGYLASVATVVRTASREALQGAKPQGSEHATFALLIGTDGRVRHVTPVELSNVAAYDDGLGAAVQNIATFGPPPAALIAGHDAVALDVVFQGSNVAVRVADPAATTPDR